MLAAGDKQVDLKKQVAAGDKQVDLKKQVAARDIQVNDRDKQLKQQQKKPIVSQRLFGGKEKKQVTLHRALTNDFFF